MFYISSRLLVFVIIVINFSFCYCQDTLSIYFSIGSHQITEKEQLKLNQLPKNYDWSSVDSVTFVGMADSVGKIQSNLRLSMRRAKQVEKYTKRFINVEIPTQTYARGEAYHPNKQLNRRVDVILYHQTPSPEKQDVPKVHENKCYTVDYDVLHFINWRIIKHRNKEKALLELPENYRLPTYDLYYGARTVNGDFSYRKIRWKEQSTGRMWWKKKRYVTTLPKSSFVNYKLFRVDEPPCNDCNEPFDSLPKISKFDSCLVEDLFVINNFQFSYKFFKKDRVKIRVPKEYIDTSINYYSLFSSDQEKLNWKTKNNRRKSHYYFTELEQTNGEIQFIYKDDICPKKNYDECIESKQISSFKMPYCASKPPPPNNFTFIIEAGNHYQNERHLPYAALGVVRDYYASRFSLLIGSDINLGLFSSLRYQYHFLHFPLQQINPLKTWHEPNINHDYFGSLYLGSGLKTSLNNKIDPLFEQNLHLGFVIDNYKDKPVISRVFVQFGYGHDYLNNQVRKFYPILHGGIVFRLTEF